jgi:hypothetical protein
MRVNDCIESLSGVTESGTYLNVYPGYSFTDSSQKITIIPSQKENIGIVCYVRLSSTNAVIDFRFNWGTTEGYVFNLDLISKEIKLKTFNGTVLKRVNTVYFKADTWYKVKMYRVGTLCHFEINGYHLCYDSLEAPIDASKIEILSGTTTDFLVSDLVLYEHQCIYGQFSINGEVSSDAIVRLHYQDTGILYDFCYTSENGHYSFLVETNDSTDPVMFVYGYAKNNNSMQPKGVSNIRLSL